MLTLTELTTEAILRNLSFAQRSLATGDTQHAAHLIGLAQADLERVTRVDPAPLPVAAE